MYKGKHYKKERLSDRILSIPLFDWINLLIDKFDGRWDRIEEKIERCFNVVGAKVKRIVIGIVGWFKED